MQSQQPRIFALRVTASLDNGTTGRFLPNTPTHEDNRRWYLSLDGGKTWEKSIPVSHQQPLPVRFNKEDPTLSDQLQFEVYYQDKTALMSIEPEIIATFGRITNSTLDLASPFKQQGNVQTVAVLKPGEKPRFEFTVTAGFKKTTESLPDSIVQFAIDPEMDVEIYPTEPCD
jgi:hypothetical protein